MNETADRAAFVYVGAFVEELARAGVRHVCISPGSRSTPLALTVARHSGLRTWMHVDERACAFFALGLAREVGETVALLCTSGTAAANFFPAVVEAKSAGVPLLVLTADRPPELREVGAAQTIDQNRLYGSHVKWFTDVALPEATPDLLRYVRTLAGRAVALCRAVPAGPVHLNFPFREPLVPMAVEPPPGLDAADSLAWNGRSDGEPWVRVVDSQPILESEQSKRIGSKLRNAQRPLIVCGPQHDRELGASLSALAQRLNAPLLADPLSQVRWGSHDRSGVVDRYDAFLRHDVTATALAPDLILRVGGVPTSKALLQYLKRHSNAPLIVVDAARWPDPSLEAHEMVHADPGAFCNGVLAALGDKRAANGTGGWLDQWSRVNDAAGNALERYCEAVDEPFEGAVLADVAGALQDGAALFVSSSMPVRDLDAFAGGDARDIRVLSNRGANGIDGVVSSALGVAASRREASGGPVVLVIGDLALYHDMNGLLAGKHHELDLTIVLINNDGGGIFSFLPQAAETAHFETLYGTPHGLDFRHAAELYGAAYTLVSKPGELRDAVEAGVSGHGVHIVEIRTDRLRNVTLHAAAWDAVASALADR